MTRISYVLIDLENVTPETLAGLSHEHIYVMIFVGDKQAKISTPLAISFQNLGKRGKYIQIEGNGPNALDFHIAYYIGRLCRETPGCEFHIISKDKGFDPLIKHLQLDNIQANRLESIEQLPFLTKVEVKPPGDRVSTIIAHLTKMKQARPRKIATLKSTINSLFKKELAQSDLDTLFNSLVKRGKVAVNGELVTYKLGESV